jgi:hypothetical protein
MDLDFRTAAVGVRRHVPRANGRFSIQKRANERRRADELLRNGADEDRSPLLSARAAELTSARNRRALAHSLERTAGELEGRVLPSAVPLNRAGARPHLDLVRALAVGLRAAEPVSARGVLLVQELLTDGYGSPLYNRERADDLRPALEQTLSALEPTRKGAR